MTEEKYKIAIIKFYENNKYSDEYSDVERIVENITDWSFVSKEEFILLDDWCRRQNGYDKYRVIQHYEFEKPIPMILSEIKKQAELDKAERKKQAELASEKRKQKELKKLAKNEAQEKELLAKLEAKYKKRI